MAEEKNQDAIYQAGLNEAGALLTKAIETLKNLVCEKCGSEELGVSKDKYSCFKCQHVGFIE